MALNAKEIKSNGDRVEQPVLAAGSYPARLVLVAALGVQEQRPYQGKAKDPVDELMCIYESTDEFTVDEEGNENKDRPRWFTETFPLYGLGADQAKSTKRYYAIDPEEKVEGDWAKLIGSPVMVTLTKTQGKGKNAERFFNNVAGLSTMRTKDAENLPQLINDPKVFDFDEPDIDVFMSLHKWIQDKIKGAVNYEGSDLQEAVNNYKEPDDKSGGDSKSSDGGSEDIPDNQKEESGAENQEDNGEW